MSREVYKYAFAESVALDEVESSLLLSIMSVESLHGESDVKLDAGHYLDVSRRACIIDGSTDVGRDLNRLFIGFLRREFGKQEFRVERVTLEQAAVGTTAATP